jgi:hypothetical protein
MSKWDKGISFEYAYSAILSSIRASTRRSEHTVCYDYILLVQLKNGARISEATRAFIEYTKTRRTELTVNVSKTKTRPG